MTVILMFLPLAAIFFILRKRYPHFDVRLTLILSSALWGLLLVLITEISSLFRAFNYHTLSAAWGFLSGGLGVMALYRWKKIRLPSFRLTVLQWIQIVCIAGIAIITLVIAVISAPNNWDAMVYHMSRAAHWVQNESVAHYPTSILWQLYHPPFAEFQIAHLQILSGGDYLSQIPQWLSMIGCVLGISLITKQLGGSKSAQIFAAFFTATIPMGILQASTAQNDYVVAFWLIALLVLIFETEKNRELFLYFLIGTCLGLAALTKTTAYLYGLPIMLYFIFREIRQRQPKLILRLVAICLIALFINLPHFSRNYDIFNGPFGSTVEISRHRNENIGLKGTTINLIRNLGMYAGTVEPVNSILNSTVKSISSWINLDLNDPRYTLEDHQFIISKPAFHEDTMASSWHLVIAFISMIVISFKRKQIGNFLFIHLGLLTFAGFLIFCILLKWQMWHVRLHLPLLVISAAWVGLLADISKKWVMWALTAFLAVMVLPVFYFNPNKPLVADYNIFNLPRREVMITRKNLVVPYIESVNYLVDEKDCYQTGLYLPDQEWEYPFWSLYADTGKPFRLEHVNVENETADIPMPAFAPCAIIATQSTGDTFTLRDGTVYHLTWNMAPVFVYTR